MVKVKDQWENVLVNKFKTFRIISEAFDETIFLLF